MFEQAFLDKKKLDVDIQLTTGEHYRGNLFLGQGERLSDLLNDVRLFLPLEVEGGGTVIIGKQSIVEIVPARVNPAGKEQITDQSDGMSLEVALKILALPERHTLSMIEERASIMKAALTATGIDFQYVISASTVAAEALSGVIKMKELEDE